MNIFKFAGLVFILLALLGAVAETMAHIRPGVGGGLLSTHDVLYTHWPSKLIVAKIHIERVLGAWAWDPFAVSVLAIPAWLLFGLPGGFLFWLGVRRPAGARQEVDEMEESLFLFDSLAERAREEGYTEDDEPRFEPQFATEYDGRPPDRELLEDLDETTGEETSEAPSEETDPAKER